MRELAVALIASVALVGCAQMSGADSSPETQCRYFARNEGLAVVQVNGVDVAGSGHNVRLRLADGLGRQFDATCNTATGPHWTQPLPANVFRSDRQMRE